MCHDASALPGRSSKFNTMGGRLAMEPEREGPIKAIVQLLSEEIDEVVRTLREHLKEASPELLRADKAIKSELRDTPHLGIKDVRAAPGITSKAPRTTKDRGSPGHNRPDLRNTP